MLREPGWTSITLNARGKPLHAAGFTGPQRAGLAMASAGGPEPLLFSCFADRTTANAEVICANILTTLALDGLPPDVRFPEIPLEVAGHALTVPPGCGQVPGDTRLRCAVAELYWRDVYADCKGSADQHRDGWEALLKAVGTINSHLSIQCTVFGERTTCDRYVFTPRAASPSVIVTRVSGCSEPMLQCTIPDGAGTTYPPPCDQVFAGSPAAPP
jgi:hypothetical protein